MKKKVKFSGKHAKHSSKKIRKIKSKKTVKHKAVKKKSIRSTKKSSLFSGVGKKESKVPKKFIRVPSLIQGFDKLIQGGFEKNSTNLIIASSGAGKSIFSTQFLVGGMKKGESCLYVTFEEKKEQFYLNMKEFGWDLEEYERKGLFTFLEYTPIKVKTMLEEGGGAIESTILEKKISRIVIDSMSSFVLLFEKELDKREASLSLFNMIRNWGCTSLLTFERNPEIEGNMDSRAIEFESDSIVVMYNIRIKNKRERYLEIIKMRGTNHSKQIFPYTIGKKGIVISGKSTSKQIKGLM